MRTLLFFLKQAIVTPFFLRRLDFAATEQLATVARQCARAPILPAGYNLKVSSPLAAPSQYARTHAPHTRTRSMYRARLECY